MSQLDELVLALNRNFFAIEVTDTKDAICSLVLGRAVVVDEDYNKYTLDEWIKITNQFSLDTDFTKKYPIVIKSPSISLFAPHVIAYQRNDSIPIKGRSVRFSRKSIMQRDNYTCQYCGVKPKKEDINLDHIIPKSRGGTNSWINLVASCIYCNAKKGDRLLTELGWKLIQEPKEPKWKSHIGTPFNQIKAEIWNKFLT